MDDVVMSKIATKKKQGILGMAVNAEKHQDLFPQRNPVLWAITRLFF
jgi:predicted DNA repair protein MutK